MVEISLKNRPSDRVRNYVLEEFSRSSDSPRLPTMRQIASQLDVSLATVQLVYRQLKHEGHISTRAGDGTFLMHKPAKTTTASLNFVLNYLPSQEEMAASDLGKVYGGMLHASIQLGRQVSFAPLRNLSAPAQELQGLVQNGNADGIIIFPTGPERELVDCCQKNQIPYVCWQPPYPEANSNFVSAEHFTPGYTIGRAFAAGERKRIAFFTFGQLTRSTSAWELLSGITCGITEETGKADISLFYTPSPRHHSPEELDKQIVRWLHQRLKALPNGIFCHRMSLARSVMKSMANLGLKSPDDFALITHDDVFSPVQNLQVTSTGAPLMDIGRALIEMLMNRIDNNNQAFPPVRIPSLFAGGQTTSAAENTVLGI